MASALEILKSNETVLSPSVRERWTMEQLATIITTVAQGASLAEFAMFTELAQALDLNPLAREIWFTKAKNGKVMIMVGRDGLLKCARRDVTYHSIDYDVHRENDTFRVVRQEDGTRTVHHEYEGSATKRGAIVGAWAMIRRNDGTWTNYTYTPWDEYVPKTIDAYTPWGKQESAMIAKCAQSLCLRIGCGITGVVGEDEVVGNNERQAITAGTGSGDAAGIELPERVEGVMVRAAELGHAGYANRAAVEIALGGRDDASIDAWVSTAIRDLDALEAARKSGQVSSQREGGDGSAAEEATSVPSSEESGDDAAAEAVVPPNPAVIDDTINLETLRRRLSGLYDFRSEAEGQEGNEDRLAELDAEIDQVEGLIKGATEAYEGQATLDV